MPHSEYLKRAQRRIDSLLEAFLPSIDSDPAELHHAMRYSALNPGKRLRPALLFATGEMLGAEPKVLDLAATSVELVHAYSLIHDDLPCMDDDDLRRGIPTCHIKFDEATAVLAGDALQTLAFELLSDSGLCQMDAERRVKMINLLARSSGSLGMGGGQAIELQMTDQAGDLQTLENMHNMKTGALINASIELGYWASNADDQDLLRYLQRFAQHIGLAFQIQDDILDIECDTQTLGKPQGSDVDNNKMTFPSLLGLDGAKKRANQLVEQALESLDNIPYQSDVLANFARYTVNRIK